MKYYLFTKKLGGIIAGRNAFEFENVYESFELLEKQTKLCDDLGYKCMVIYGKELEWEIETEEIITKTVKEKSRKLKRSE